MDRPQIWVHCHLWPAVRAPAGGRELHNWQQQLLFWSRSQLRLAAPQVPSDYSPLGSTVHLRCTFLRCTTKTSCRWWQKWTLVQNTLTNVKAEQQGGSHTQAWYKSIIPNMKTLWNFSGKYVKTFHFIKWEYFGGFCLCVLNWNILDCLSYKTRYLKTLPWIFPGYFLVFHRPRERNRWIIWK